jgi:hypothetical protein
MPGAVPPLIQYPFVAWYLVKNRATLLLPDDSKYVCSLHKAEFSHSSTKTSKSQETFDPCITDYFVPQNKLECLAQLSRHSIHQTTNHFRFHDSPSKPVLEFFTKNIFKTFQTNIMRKEVYQEASVIHRSCYVLLVGVQVKSETIQIKTTNIVAMGKGNQQ